MKTNKMLPDSSISKVWENFRKMNGIVLTLLASNWVEAEDGIFTNTVEYDGFTSDEILEVDLYDNGNLSEDQINEYDSYITKFDIIDGGLVATATTKPTQNINILCRGEFVINKVTVPVVDESNNSGNSLINYSTEETIVGTWIDGSPVYRKVHIGIAPANTMTVPCFETEGMFMIKHEIYGLIEGMCGSLEGASNLILIPGQGFLLVINPENVMDTDETFYLIVDYVKTADWISE